MSAVSPLAYNLLWPAVALLLVALASAVISRRVRWRDLRREAAEEALLALAGYSEWLAAQRRSPAFQGDRTPEAEALGRLRQLQQAVFPELGPAAGQLLDVHAAAVDFLWKQQLLRVRDPEAWLESDHDAGFMALWRQHREAVHRLADLLRQRAGGPLRDAEPESVYPA